MATEQGTSPKYTVQELRLLWETRKKIVVAENGCWLWQGGKNEAGYGYVSHNGIMQRATRVAYTLCVGPLAPGHNVCHNCPGGDNPSCVNPGHLFPGTQKKNVEDCFNKGRYRPRSAPAGENNPNAKITVEIVRNLRHDIAKGMLQRVAMDKYRLSRATVQRIVSRRAWPHVADVESIETIWGTF